uniref:Uncharacterized protein n=1 Tax=Zea mays TaxID=4577 RepID=B6TUA0_MAIZE|nr:hypothetical protein [Zea mays]
MGGKSSGDECSAPLCCLLFQSPRSIRSLAFLCLIAGGDCKLVEVVLLLCSEVLPCSLLHLCACVVLCSSDYCHRGLVPGLPAARCSSSRTGAVDVSHGLSSDSSISVNLPLCRPGRGRQNWFSGTELRVR